MADATLTPPDDAGLVRGGAWLLIAKLVAVVGGFALYWGLARLFTGTLGPADGTAAFGTWGATFGVIHPLNAVAAAGTLQMMSRWIASRGGAEGAGRAFWHTAGTQLAIVLALVVALALAAGAIAERVLNDASYAVPLRLAALIPLFYALRALYEGYLNGTRRFTAQAWLDIGATLLRLLFVLGAAAVGRGALGAIGGFVAAAAAMAVVAVLWVRPGRGDAGAGPGAREILGFQAAVLAVTLATQYLLHVDLLAVKALASPDPVVADRLAGAYTAAQKLAQVPLSVALALGTLLFAYVASDAERSAPIVRGGMRALLMVMVPSAALLAVNAPETLALVFPAIAQGDAGAGAAALVWLALGSVPCALLLTATTLVTASGRPGLAAAVAGATLALTVFAVRFATPLHGPAGAAAGASAAWTLGLVAALALLRGRVGEPVALRSALRIVAAGVVVAALAHGIRTGGAWLVLEDLVLVAVFVGVLIALRELHPAEVRIALRLGR